MEDVEDTDIIKGKGIYLYHSQLFEACVVCNAAQ